jgi:carboxyl-terminal processing protease
MYQSIGKSAFCKGLLFGGAVVALATGSLFTPVFSSAVKATLEDSPKTVVDEAWQIVNNEFVDKEFNQVDWQEMRQDLLDKRYTSLPQAYKAIRLALKKLGDPYTRFLEPEEFEMLTSQTSGELSGVGLQLAVDKRTSDLLVVTSLKNSPAMKAGIKTGDRILKINGKPTALMDLKQAFEALQGEVGTEVSLQLASKDKGVFELTLTRAEIELPSVSYNLKQEDQIRVGYIKLDEFSSHAAEQMKQAIEDLSQQKASAFVLDLRGNPGGLLFSSVEIARMWMEKGNIVHTIDRKGGDRQFSANGTALTNRPLVILVDRGSASASEILTGALKDNGRATVVGTTTYGKGTVQSVHSLSDGSGLAVTISRYYLPNGTNITKKGIKPDIQQELSTEQQSRFDNDPSLLGTNADPQYKRAIAILKTSPLSTAPHPAEVGVRPGS